MSPTEILFSFPFWKIITIMSTTDDSNNHSEIIKAQMKNFEAIGQATPEEFWEMLLQRHSGQRQISQTFQNWDFQCTQISSPHQPPPHPPPIPAKPTPQKFQYYCQYKNTSTKNFGCIMRKNLLCFSQISSEWSERENFGDNRQIYSVAACPLWKYYCKKDPFCFGKVNCADPSSHCLYENPECQHGDESLNPI